MHAFLRKIRASNNGSNATAFLLIFVSVFVYVCLRNVDMSIGDTDWYLTVADGCIDGAGLHISRFPQTFRGCILPLYLQFLKNSYFGSRIGWAATVAFIMASMFSFILPSFFESERDKSCLIYGGLLTGVYIFIFGDTLAYPLSDLFATFFLISFAWLLKISGTEKRSRSKITISLLLLIGICMYIAYNTRAVFLYGIVMVLFLYLWRGEYDIGRRILSVFVILIGAGISSIPQCFVNYYCEGAFSPRIYTENYTRIYGGEAMNLQMQQMEWGLNFDRYETFVGGWRSIRYLQYFLSIGFHKKSCIERI